MSKPGKCYVDPFKDKRLDMRNHEFEYDGFKFPVYFQVQNHSLNSTRFIENTKTQL